MEYFSETGICGLSLKDIFSQTIDRVFLDELIVFQVQTHILYILDQVLPEDRFSALILVRRSG